MTIFMIFVAGGLVSLLYILVCVTHECSKAGRNSGTLEHIPPPPPLPISDHKRRAAQNSERTA